MTDPSTPAPHTCPTCSKTYTTLSGLNRHRTVHTPPSITCTTCGLQFRRGYELQRHMATHDPERWKHWCDGCGRRYSRRDVMMRHRRRCAMFVGQWERVVEGQEQEEEDGVGPVVTDPGVGA